MRRTKKQYLNLNKLNTGCSPCLEEAKIMQKKKQYLNLNKLNTGCSPCLEEAKIMQKKIRNRKLSEIKIKEIKNIVSSIFKEK